MHRNSLSWHMDFHRNDSSRNNMTIIIGTVVNLGKSLAECVIVTDLMLPFCRPASLTTVFHFVTIKNFCISWSFLFQCEIGRGNLLIVNHITDEWCHSRWTASDWMTEPCHIKMVDSPWLQFVEFSKVPQGTLSFKIVNRSFL